MGPAKQAVIGGPAAGEQKQGHLNAKGLLKQAHNALGLPKAAGLDGVMQALAWLLGKGGEELVEPVALKCLGRRHAANLLKAVIHTALAMSNGDAELLDCDGFLKMLGEIVQALGQDHHWIGAVGVVLACWQAMQAWRNC